MAKAKKCDRCGSFYEDNQIEMDREMPGYRTCFDGGKNPTRLDIMKRYDYTGAMLDLCDSCFESLFDWINYYKEDSNAGSE